MVSRFTATWTSAAELHSAQRYTGIARSDTQASDADATGSVRTESCTEDFGRRQRENRQCVIGRVRHVWTSDAGGFTRQRDDPRTDGGSGTRTASTENSADYRSAEWPFDAGSPSNAVATNPEAYGLHRRDGRGTRQRNLEETATLRRRGPTGVFCTRDRTRCGG